MRTADPALRRRRREGVLRAARACFARRGFAGAGMKELCAAARLSPGALYRYFPSKDAIIAALVEEDIAWLLDRIEALRAAPDPLAGLHALLDALCVEAGAADLALHMEVAAEQRRNRPLRALARSADARCRAALAETFASAMANRQLAAYGRPELLADGVAALFDGWLWRGALHGPRALRDSLPAMHDALRRLLAPDAR